MSSTRRIDVEQLRTLDLHQGDVLRVLAEDGDGAVVLIEHSATGQTNPSAGSARDWVRSARGSVRLAEVRVR